MKFCPECNSLLYYIEIDGVLNEKCKVCGFNQPSKDRLIERTIYKTNNLETAENISHFISDNTLPRTIHQQCPNPNCPSRKDKKLQEAVMYSDPETMKIIYICVVCNTQWSYA